MTAVIFGITTGFLGVLVAFGRAVVRCRAGVADTPFLVAVGLAVGMGLAVAVAFRIVLVILAVPRGVAVGFGVGVRVRVAVAAVPPGACALFPAAVELPRPGVAVAGPPPAGELGAVAMATTCDWTPELPTLGGVVAVAVAVKIGVSVGRAVAVALSVAVAVEVGVLVDDAVAVGVTVGLGVLVGVGDVVAVAIGVGELVALGVTVSVGVVDGQAPGVGAARSGRARNAATSASASGHPVP